MFFFLKHGVIIIKQVAQLSQRDRTAGLVSYGQKWKTGTGRQYLRTVYYRSIFNQCDVLGQQRNRNRRKNAKQGLLRRSSSSKVIEVGTNRKPV